MTETRGMTAMTAADKDLTIVNDYIRKSDEKTRLQLAILSWFTPPSAEPSTPLEKEKVERYLQMDEEMEETIRDNVTSIANHINYLSLNLGRVIIKNSSGILRGISYSTEEAHYKAILSEGVDGKSTEILLTADKQIDLQPRQ